MTAPLERRLLTVLANEQLGADAHAAVYSCGPPAMLEAVGVAVGTESFRDPFAADRIARELSAI